MDFKKTLKTSSHSKFPTKNKDGTLNGYLVPLYNIHDGFFSSDAEPKQVYLTVVSPGEVKGPHLHYIRQGCFTCIKGNIRVVVKVNGNYEIYFSGEDHHYLSIEIPKGTPAALQNIGNEDAFVLNMPSPAWTPQMNDEHSADFSDFNFQDFS